MGFGLAAAVACTKGSASPGRAPGVLLELSEVGSPALAVGLASGSRVLHRSVAGVRVYGKPELAALGDSWAIGSCTKAMTATLAAVLVEQGRLTWRTRIKEVLPALQGTSPAYDQVTLEQLLSHTAGIIVIEDEAQAPGLPRLTGDSHSQRVQAARWLLQQPPAGTPGATYLYSNLGYVIAAAMLEEVLHEPWEEAVLKRVLTPLGLKAKIGRPDPGEIWGHTTTGQGWQPQDPAVEGPYESLLNPAGFLSMPLDDTLAWAQIHLRGLQGQDCPILKAGSFKKLHTALHPQDPHPALGWMEDGPRSWHNGSTLDFCSCILLDPAQDRAVVLLANGDTPDHATAGNLARAAADVISRWRPEPGPSTSKL